MSQNSVAENCVDHGEEAIYPTQQVGPINFTAINRLDAAQLIIDLSNGKRGRHVHLVNAYTIALADKSLDYRRALGKPALNFADGKPIGWVSAMSGHAPRVKQVRGPQLFLDVFDRGRSSGVRHFLLGSTPEVLKALEENLRERFPGVLIVGAQSPPFRAVSKEELAEQDLAIRDSQADIVWVGLGTPKQDFEAQRLAMRLPVVAVAIGAAFDFAAGSAREAPRWMTRLGVEWVFRFAREPRRLWRRYVFGNMRFVKTILLWAWAVHMAGRRSGDPA